MIDWDALVIGPCMETFGEAAGVPYTRAGGATFTVDGVFDEGSINLRLVADPSFVENGPVLGVRLSQFPTDYDPRNAKDDTFVVRGVTYVVREGRPDSHGWALLSANVQ